MKTPFEAYTGAEPYIFISYAHRDAAMVFPLLIDWHNAGYRIWYDEGIDPGNEWPEEIASALEKCRLFMVFITPRSAKSKNVKNEINFALNLDKDFIAVHLEETQLPSGLSLRMGDIQAVMKYRMTDDMFDAKIRKIFGRKVKGAQPDKPAKVDSIIDGNEPRMESPEKTIKPLTDEVRAKHPKFSRFLDSAADVVSTVRDAMNETGGDEKEIERRLKEKFEKKKHGRENSREASGHASGTEKVRVETRVRTGCISTILSFALMGGAGYYVYYYVVNRYSTIKIDYLKTECPAYKNRDQKMAVAETLTALTDRDRALFELEEELSRCRAMTRENLAIKNSQIETMTIPQLEEYFLQRENKTDSWKRSLFHELREKYNRDIEGAINTTRSETAKAVLREQYRKLLVDLIRDTYK